MRRLAAAAAADQTQGLRAGGGRLRQWIGAGADDKLIRAPARRRRCLRDTRRAGPDLADVEGQERGVGQQHGGLLLLQHPPVHPRRPAALGAGGRRRGNVRDGRGALAGVGGESLPGGWVGGST